MLGGVFFTATLRVTKPLCHQKSIGRDAHRGVVVESPPASPLEVTQPKVLLEVLVIALDAPAHLGLEHHALQRRVFGQGR